MTTDWIMSRAAEHPKCQSCQHLAHITAGVSDEGCGPCQRDQRDLARKALDAGPRIHDEDRRLIESVRASGQSAEPSECP